MASSKSKKVVIRHLPADLPESIFWKTVDPLLSNNPSENWRSFSAGKLRSDDRKVNVASRAYVEFTDDQVMIAFAKAFDGHVFIDRSGNRTQVRVEMAPFQRIPPPRNRRKPDPRSGTIEEDADYVAFVENLSKPSEPITAPEVKAAPTTTPLLEHLRQQKAAKAKKAEQRANAKGSAELKPASSTSVELPAEASSKSKRRRGKAKEAEIPAQPAPTPPSAPAAEPKDKKPKPPRKEAGGVSGRLMGAAIGQGGGRLAARRAEEKAAKEQAIQDRAMPSSQPVPAQPLGGPMRQPMGGPMQPQGGPMRQASEGGRGRGLGSGRGRGRGRGGQAN